MKIAYSVNSIPIRSTYERWYHITENHDDLSSYFYEVLETVEKPDFVIRGNIRNIKSHKKSGKKQVDGSYI